MYCTAANHSGGDATGGLCSSPRTFSQVAQWQSTSNWAWEIRVWEGQVSLDFGERFRFFSMAGSVE